MTTESARHLVEIAETGGARDLDQIYREHAATVSRWVRRLSDATDVSDIVQEVFEVAHRRLASFRGDSKLTTWLYTITIHVVSARRRRAKLRRLLFLRVVDQTDIWSEPIATPFETLSQKQASRVVYQTLDRMSERDRTLLILFEIERLAITDIAAVLELSSNSVSVGLHRARARFRKLLARHFPGEVPDSSLAVLDGQIDRAEPPSPTRETGEAGAGSSPVAPVARLDPEDSCQRDPSKSRDCAKESAPIPPKSRQGVDDAQSDA